MVCYRHGAYVGGKESPTHERWRNMLKRCYHPKRGQIITYAGITVCERWHDYTNFVADMGLIPGPRYSLDRIDGAGNYEPGNCRWATAYEQGTNRKTVRWYMSMEDGEIDTGIGWARRLGISHELAYWRWKNKGTFEKGKVWKELKWLPQNIK